MPASGVELNIHGVVKVESKHYTRSSTNWLVVTITDEDGVKHEVTVFQSHKVTNKLIITHHSS